MCGLCGPGGQAVTAGLQLQDQLLAHRPRHRILGDLRVLRAIDQRLDLVVALQQQRAQLGAQLQLAFAQPVEQGLDMVGEADHRVEAEDARRALDGVRTAEQRVQQAAVVGRVFQLQQQLLDRLDLLARLAQKGGQGVGDEAGVHVGVFHAAAPWSVMPGSQPASPRSWQAWRSGRLA